MVSLGSYLGHDTRMVTASEVRSLYPFLDLDASDVLGGMYSPTDGSVDPDGITRAYTAGAREGRKDE